MTDLKARLLLAGIVIAGALLAALTAYLINTFVIPDVIPEGENEGKS